MKGLKSKENKYLCNPYYLLNEWETRIKMAANFKFTYRSIT